MKDTSIYIENAKVLNHQHMEGDQHIIRLESEKCSQSAKSGMFIHLKCNENTLMRRPFSIMRASKEEKWIEILYKTLGDGTNLLKLVQVGDTLNYMGPIGNGFSLDEKKTLPLLIGGGVGIPPLIFLANELKEFSNLKPLILFGSEVPFPFKYSPSKYMIKDFLPEVTASPDFIESMGFVSRLASQQDYPGCYKGYIHELAEHWINTLHSDQLEKVCIYSCGPTPMLEAVSLVARKYGIDCQICIEEHMACAVGGCAGCIVKIKKNDKIISKRVCVDGPVFKSNTIYYE